MGGVAADRARVLEEFWLRKRQAAQNKARGQLDYGQYVSFLAQQSFSRAQSRCHVYGTILKVLFEFRKEGHNILACDLLTK